MICNIGAAARNSFPKTIHIKNFGKISMEKIGDYHHAVNIHEIAELKT